jgi:hypothetical protein
MFVFPYGCYGRIFEEGAIVCFGNIAIFSTFRIKLPTIMGLIKRSGNSEYAF